jgi:hypothetical protein
VTISSQIETCYLVFQNLPLGTTIHDVAENLRTPVHLGGCGVSILSSAPLPSFSSASHSVVVQFGSIHEARIASMGWETVPSNSSIIPASHLLLSTITLVPYHRDGLGTHVGVQRVLSAPSPTHPQSNSNSPPSRARGLPQRAPGNAIRYSPMPSTSQLSQPGPSSARARRTHNFNGYWMRKGHKPG